MNDANQRVKAHQESLEKKLKLQTDHIEELEQKLIATTEDQSKVSQEEFTDQLIQFETYKAEKFKEIHSLKDQNQNLLNKIDDMEMLNQYVGHMNSSQKIKYVQRLKEENNELKKQLTYWQQECHM